MYDSMKCEIAPCSSIVVIITKSYDVPKFSSVNIFQVMFDYFIIVRCLLCVLARN